MTQKKLQSILDLTKQLKSEVVVVTKTKTRTFIDFNNEEYKDTFIEDNIEIPCLYVWNTTFNHWNIISIESIDYIELY